LAEKKVQMKMKRR